MYMPSDQNRTQWAAYNNIKTYVWHASIKFKRDAAKRRYSNGEDSSIPSAPKKGKGGSLSLAKYFKAAFVTKFQTSDAKINDVVNAALHDTNKNDDESK